MLEKIGDKDIIVRDYTDNFSAKEYIQSELIPKAFPDIPVGKLNAGFVGVINEYLGQLTEDSYHTASLMLNENFITRAILPSSIYAEAGLFDLGYTFATPSKAQFAVQLWIDDILERGQPVRGSTAIDNDANRRDTGKYRYVLDRDTKVIVGNNTYRFDYDVIIEWQKKYVNGRELVPFKARYDIPDGQDVTAGNGFVNSIALQGSRWIKCRVTQKGWLILLVTLQEFNRKVIETSITDNLKTTNSDIELSWPDQIAGLDLVHIDTKGQRHPMRKKLQYSDYETVPFAYYQFTGDNSISLSFSPAIPAWKPAFNDRIEATIYTTIGAAGNFDTYDSSVPIAVEKTGARYEYNADTHIVAVCYSGSTLGTDKKGIEMLRSDVKSAYNTVKVLSTDHDLEEWFLNFAQRYDTRSTFFKRRDDPTGRLFSQFVAITDGDYVYPTNTLTIEVNQLPDPLNLTLSEFDSVDAGSNEFIIKPGHLWEYKVDGYEELIDESGAVTRVPKLSRSTVVMVKRSDGSPAMIHDSPLPRLDSATRPFIFVNPFLIKLHRQPQLTACYNYLLHHASYLRDDHINDVSEFRHVQLSQFTVDRSLTEKSESGEHVDGYTVRVLVNPILPETTIEESFRYVRGSVDEPEAANFSENNLRLLLVFDTSTYGESGYLEMYPINVLEGGIIEFEAKFATLDNVTADGIMIVDPVATAKKFANDTITHLPDQRRPEVYRETIMLDAEESRFKFVAMMKVDRYVEDVMHLIPAEPLYGDERLRGWQEANIFGSDSNELTLFKPMTMMRSTVLFAGKAGSYRIRADLVPFVGYTLARDDTQLLKFIRQFNEQYAAVEPVIFERLDNNCHLDLKLFNTYGRSNNYFIGDVTDNHHLLDSVQVKISFQMSVRDRMAWSTTAEEVITEIRDFFSSLDSDSQPNIYISNLIRLIEVNHPNVDHLKFLGINGYDATEQYIRVRYEDVSDLDENEMKIVVPEIIQCLPEDIQLIEEG